MQRTDNNTNARSVLALLRGLVPQRQLTFNEALRIAELQANRLLEHFSIVTVKDPGNLGGSDARLRPGGGRCSCDVETEEVSR